MRKTAYQVAVAFLSLVALIYGRSVSFPDNVHTLHGLPLNWGVHQLVTIVGPVDTWMVNPVNLALDIAFWFGIVLLIPIVIERVLSE